MILAFGKRANSRKIKSGTIEIFDGADATLESLSTRCRVQVNDLGRMGRNAHVFRLVRIAIGKVEGEIFVILAAGDGKQQVVTGYGSGDLVTPGGTGSSGDRVARYPAQFMRFRNQHHDEPWDRLVSIHDLPADRAGVICYCEVAIECGAQYEFELLGCVVLP